MKQSIILLITVAALIAAPLSAQVERSQVAVNPVQPQLRVTKPEVKMEEMQMRTPGTAPAKAPSRADGVDVWYNRPAGAFPASVVVEDGVYAGLLYSPYYAITPYVDYVFNGFAVGFGDDAIFEWNYEHEVPTEDGTSTMPIWDSFYGQDLTVQYGYEVDSVPFLYVSDSGASNWGSFHLGTIPRNNGEGIVSGTEHVSKILSVPSTLSIWGQDFLKSSKSFSLFGRYGDKRNAMVYYSGLLPHGSNERGWWFGKNAGTANGLRVDGIAQAFEKPTYPYLLKQVVVDCAIVEVAAPVEMTCKIYKLDEIPPYMDNDEAFLPDEPGELIAVGRASLTPETVEASGGLIFFTLYGEIDGLEYDITPTIDYPILVVVDGYNEPEMANLTDFSALISSDDAVDEGFGELAYLKIGVNDESGNLDHYQWAGLNNFFTSGAMKTGLTIFLSTENPYLTFKNSAEDGEYVFPVEGGLMEKTIDNHTYRSIELRSWLSSTDQTWYHEIPDWLNVAFTDVKDDQGRFIGVVNVEVVADPLPVGVNYREDVVRFGFPGAYVDYTFMQGDQSQDDGIEELATDGSAFPVGYYDITGRQYNGLQPGVNIVKMSDGSTKKVFKK